MIEIDSSKLPMHVKIKVENGSYVQFILKAASRKLGAQLVKLDPNMLQMLEQH
jgi:hypothetical protein